MTKRRFSSRMSWSVATIPFLGVGMGVSVLTLACKPRSEAVSAVRGSDVANDQQGGGGNVFDEAGMRDMPKGGPGKVGSWYAPPLPEEREGGTVRMGAIQAAMLPSGKILMINGSSNRFNTNPAIYRHVDNSALFDPGLVHDPNRDGQQPRNDGYQKVASQPEGKQKDEPASRPPNIDMFCGGQTQLPDGNILVVGGTRQIVKFKDGKLVEPFHGVKQSMIFDWHKESFKHTRQQPAEGRWYPTLTTLGSGNVVAMAGMNHDGKNSQVVELYNVANQAWSRVDFSRLRNQPFDAFGGAFDNYARTFLMNDGRLFITGDGAAEGNRAATQKNTLFMTVKSEDRFAVEFELGPERNDTTRLYPTQLFDPGSKDGDVLIIGGGIQNFNPTDKGDLTERNSKPDRRTVASMAAMNVETDESGKIINAAFEETVPDFLGSDDIPTIDGPAKSGRVNLNAVILPTKQFLVLGGGVHSYVDPVFHPLLYTPVSGVEKGPDIVGNGDRRFLREVMAPFSMPRLYHNTTMLLRDGRVAIMGGNSFLSTLDVKSPESDPKTPGFKPNGEPIIGQTNEWNKPTGGKDVSAFQPAETYQVEIFTPPYLYINGPRPEITSIDKKPAAANRKPLPAPIRISYGKPFPLKVSNVTDDGMVTMVRLGAITHAMDVTQKLHELPLESAGNGAFTVTPPSNPNVAPPGVYMLFYVNGKGKPSIGEMVQLGS